MKFSEKLARDWYINDLLVNRQDLEFWDLTKLLFADSAPNESKTSFPIYKFNTYPELTSKFELADNKYAIYVILINYEGRFTEIYRLLTIYNCKTVFMAWGGFPSSGKRSLSHIFNKLLNPIKLSGNLYYNLKARLLKKINFIKPYDIVFGAGSYILRDFTASVKVVPTNLPDYDHFLAAKSDPIILASGNYVVFLDIFLPYQTDLVVMNYKAVSAEEYFYALNNFFKLIEEKYKTEVVIAAHPKSNYEGDVFNGRKIYKGATTQLVKDTRFVISHHSTSLGYAVLNYKPIMFIYTSEMQKIYRDSAVQFILDFAHYLKSAVLNIDEVKTISDISINPVSVTLYDNYKYSFIVSKQSEGLTAREIFLREII